MIILTILKIIFAAALCVPLVYCCFRLTVRLIDQLNSQPQTQVKSAGNRRKRRSAASKSRRHPASGKREK